LRFVDHEIRLPVVASSPVTLAAARKLSRMRGPVWIDGPVCRPDERKMWEIDLADMLELVATVERAAPSIAVAAQWLRRMFYAGPLGGAGRRFDTFITTEDARLARPVTTADVPQSVLDALVRIGTVRIPGATAPLDRVEMSHVFVLMDIRLGSRSWAGAGFDTRSGGLLQPVLSWLGDLSSAWLGYQTPYLAARAAAGPAWTEPLTPAGLATPLAWLDAGIEGRSPIDDLLGDLDAVVLSRQPLPGGPTPIAALLDQYYTVGVPSSGTVARVADRFALWATRVAPAIPHTVGGTGVTLDPTARNWLRERIHDGVLWLLLASRFGTNAAAIEWNKSDVQTELDGPWHARMIDELADRAFAFIDDGIAGRALAWPSQSPGAVGYPGYEWVPGPPPLAVPAIPSVDDLAAAAQFFVSWRQPHQPLRPTDRLFHRVRLADPAGAHAVLLPGTSTLQVEPFSGLAGAQAAPTTGDHADLLLLDADMARVSRTYRIVAVDPVASTVTVDGTPSIGTGSRWRVIRRPRLVLVDPFSGRIGGPGANTLTVPAGWVRLDGLPDLDPVRANFDMITLEDDRSRTSRTYRVTAVHPTESRVQLDGAPGLTGATGWRIPSGIANALNPVADTLAPRADGCDAYDGLLFVVYDNEVQGPPVPFTSYSSAANATSSISGNAGYDVRSLRSPDSAARNYELGVTDPGAVAADTVAAAGFYQDNVTALRTAPPAMAPPTARIDPDGKTAIRIHIGNATGDVSGSTGDLVSAEYRALRTLLIGLHQAERAALGLPADPDLAAVAAASTQADSIALYDANTVSWDDRLRYELILLRPDLRPVA
jgi:hypothetical protein